MINPLCGTHDCNLCKWRIHSAMFEEPCIRCLNFICDAARLSDYSMLYEEVEQEERDDRPVISVVLEDGATMPTQAHITDAGYDLYSRERVIVPCYSDGVIVSTGVHMQIMPGFYGKVSNRSGLAFKHGVIAVDGTVDSGYTGEIKVKLHNISGNTYIINPGERIAQIIIIPCASVRLRAVDSLEETDRGTGGFGSSGK